MRLSTAIALGSAVTRPKFGQMMNEDRTEACALGAAFIALGLARLAPFKPLYPWAYEKRELVCPECRDRDDTLLAIGMIMHLNDVHEWTRERIADWVRTIEPPEPEALDSVRVSSEHEVLKGAIHGNS